MSAVEDVAGRLGLVLNQSPSDLCQVADQLDDVVTTLGAVAGGSVDEHLLGAVSAFTRARQAAEDAAHALRAALGHVADYLARTPCHDNCVSRGWARIGSRSVAQKGFIQWFLRICSVCRMA